VHPNLISGLLFLIVEVKMKYKRKEGMERGLGYWKVCFVLGVAVLMSGFFVAAFSVGSSSAVNVEPGGSVDTSFSLMNLGENAEDVVIEITVERGEEYLSFPDGTIFDVPAGQSVSVRAIVSVPSDSGDGDSYPVKLVFNAIEGGVNEGGTVDIVFGYSKSFNINVAESLEAREGAGNFWLWVIGIIVVIVIIWLVMKAMRKDK
jgi:uncharacterized membrane protein